MIRKTNFNYFNRDFYSLKEDLKNYIKVYYPDNYNDFSESSIGMILLELNAYIGDILSFHVDTKFNEVFFDTAQNRDSVIRLAKNLGYNPRGKTPAITLLNVSIKIPVLGDGYNPDYLLTLEKGFKASASNGQKYEVLDEIDFNTDTSITGVQNRTIIPLYNSSNEIIEYKITKTVAGIAGETKSTSLEITTANATPYMKWYIDNSDQDITEIRDIITKDDRFTPTKETDWSDSGQYNVWYEVDSLPQERVFVDSSVDGGAEGHWKYIKRRFTKEYNPVGNILLTFGAGIEDYDSYAQYTANGLTGLTVASLLNNSSLGYIPSIGTYLHCRYRTGGGPLTNAAQGTITIVESKKVASVPGSVPASILAQVVGSVEVINPIPAIGGKDFETVDEIKVYAKHHFSSQDRCVTADDYISRIALLPSKYGSVFRSNAKADPSNLNTNVYILARDEFGKLKNTGNSQLKINVMSYIDNYRLLNDFIKIFDGTIINIGIYFTIQASAEQNKKSILVNCIDALTKYFTIENWQMNDVIYISQVHEILRSVPGVVNVVETQFVNKIGNGYSNDVLAPNNNIRLTNQLIKNGGEIEITPIANKIVAPANGMIEIKYPNLDILGSAIS